MVESTDPCATTPPSSCTILRIPPGTLQVADLLKPARPLVDTRHQSGKLSCEGSQPGPGSSIPNSDRSIHHEPVLIFIVKDRPAFRLIIGGIPDIIACNVKIMVEEHPYLPVSGVQVADLHPPDEQVFVEIHHICRLDRYFQLRVFQPAPH